MACLAHQLPRNLAHDLRFRLVVDTDGELQRVPSVWLAIGSPGAGSEIHPPLFTEPDTGSPFSAPGCEPHAVVFQWQQVFYLLAFVVPGCQLRRGKVKPEMMAVLAPWDIRSSKSMDFANGYPKEPAQARVGRGGISQASLKSVCERAETRERAQGETYDA